MRPYHRLILCALVWIPLLGSAEENCPSRLIHGEELFSKRIDPNNATEARETFGKILNQFDPCQSSMTKEFKLQVLERLLLADYFIGFRLTQDLESKRAIFSQAENRSESCTRDAPEFAPCWFWAGVHLALLQETRGPIAFVSQLRKIRIRLETAQRLDPKYLGGGAARTLGKIYAQLPPFLGGGFETAQTAYREAIKADENESLNWLFLIQLLQEKSDSRFLSELEKTQTLVQPTPERIESVEAWTELKRLRLKQTADASKLQLASENPK